MSSESSKTEQFEEINIDELRGEIDQLDKSLVEILAKRAKVTQKVGQYKQQHGLPIYVPSREAALVASLRNYAEEQKVSPALVEDVIRRVMRDSYSTQNKKYNKTNPSERHIVVVGGQGALGQRFVAQFQASGYRVDVVDKDNQSELPDLCVDACLVLMAVPIDVTCQVINSLPELPADCILADITSTKSPSLQAMLAKHSGPVVGLHPMFGPDSAFVKEVIAVCHGRDEKAYDWLLGQLAIWGCVLKEIEAAEHDQLMLYIQTMRHFTSILYGSHLAKESLNLEALVDLSSPIYRLELIMTGRIFAQNPNLYADIIFSSREDAIAMLGRYIDTLKQGIEALEAECKPTFVELFSQGRSWFGEQADEFLKESKHLLLKANDSRLHK